MKALVMGFVLVFCLLAFGVFSKAEAAAGAGFITDLCWSYQVSDGVSGTLRLGLFDIGGGHFLLSGKYTHNTGEENAIHGNAEILSDKKMHSTLINASSGSDYVSSTTLKIVLDSNTLNGDFKGITTDSINGTSSFSGTLTYTTCP